MKKNTLLLAFLVSSTALVTACEKGGPRTAPDAIAKARCQSEKAFNTKKENMILANSLAQKGNVEDENAIRTYVTKFDISGDKSSTIPTVMNPNNVVLVSSIKADEAFAQSTAAESVVVQTNCENLSASAKGPGFEIQDLTIKKIDKDMIELEKTSATEVEGKSVVQEIKMKIEKSANLRAEDEELSKQIDKKNPTDREKKEKHILKASLKKAKEQQVARGNVTTKITIDVTSTLISGEKRTESYVIEQRGGELLNESSITFEGSVVQMIMDRTSVVGTPEFITEAAKAEGDSAMQVDAITGGKVAEKSDEGLSKFKVTVREKTAISELIKKLDSAAGLSQGQQVEELKPLPTATSVPESAVGQTPVFKVEGEEEAPAKEQTPVQASNKAPATKSVGVQAE